MKLDGNEHLLLMSISFSLLIVPTFPLEILIFPSYVPPVTCQPSQARKWAPGLGGEQIWLPSKKQKSWAEHWMKTELSHCKAQNFRDAPGWTLKMLQLSQSPFLKLANYSVFPLGSPSYTILFQMPFSHCISQKLLVSLTNTQAQM